MPSAAMQVMRRTRALRMSVIGALALLGLSAPAQAEMEKTSLAQTPAIMPFLAAYIAEDANIWRDNGLDVKVINLDGVATVNAVIAGSADFALSSSSALTRAAAHGQRLLALGSLNNQTGQVTIIRKDIADAAHFDPAAPLAVRAQIIKGHTVSGGSVGSVADVFLKSVARAGNVAQSDFRNPPLGASELIAAFARGAVDGFSYSLPYPQQLVAEGKAVVVADGTNGELKEFLPLATGLIREDGAFLHAGDRLPFAPARRRDRDLEEALPDGERGCGEELLRGDRPHHQFAAGRDPNRAREWRSHQCRVRFLEGRGSRFVL